MYLAPVLPPLEDETTVSWCTRLARRHANLGCADWLAMMQLSQAHVMETSDACVARLAGLTGLPVRRLRACGPRTIADRRLRYCGEEFGPGFLTRTQTSYCPACLLEDGATDSPSAGHRVGRVSWTIRPVRMCPQHGIALTRRQNAGFFERFQDMTRVAPPDGILESQAADAPALGVSSLQTYVTRRLAGEAGPAWLDGQAIDQAIRACEMLGICRLNGAFTDLRTPPLAEWHEAGAVGFDAASKGPDGIHALLDEIASAAAVKARWGGPQSVLGRLYQWFQFDTSRTDPGPIRDCVREYIIATMPIAAGTDLFGAPVARRMCHSAPTLAKQFGIHVRTINRALVLTGVLPENDPEVIDARTTFDADRGEALADRITRSLPIKSVPGYLDCNRTQAQMLVKAGILRQIVPGLGMRGGVLTQVPLDEIDEFLRSFRARGCLVASASAEMVDVITASEIARETATDIVRMVLEGRLCRIECLDETPGFRSVLVDPDEIRAVGNADEDRNGLSVAETARRLGVSTVGVSYLRTRTDAAGRPFLRANEIENARGSVRYRFAAKEVARFREDHVSLKELAEAEGISAKAMSYRLARAGAEPILERKLLRAKLFRRVDL